MKSKISYIHTTPNKNSPNKFSPKSSLSKISPKYSPRSPKSSSSPFSPTKSKHTNELSLDSFEQESLKIQKELESKYAKPYILMVQKQKTEIEELKAKIHRLEEEAEKTSSTTFSSTTPSRLSLRERGGYGSGFIENSSSQISFRSTAVEIAEIPNEDLDVDFLNRSSSDFEITEHSESNSLYGTEIIKSQSMDSLPKNHNSKTINQDKYSLINPSHSSNKFSENKPNKKSKINNVQFNPILTISKHEHDLQCILTKLKGLKINENSIAQIESIIKSEIKPTPNELTQTNKEPNNQNLKRNNNNNNNNNTKNNLSINSNVTSFQDLDPEIEALAFKLTELKKQNASLSVSQIITTKIGEFLHKEGIKFEKKKLDKQFKNAFKVFIECSRNQNFTEEEDNL